MDTRILFGKYKKRTISDVLTFDQKYCRWLVTTDEVGIYIMKERQNCKDLAKVLRENGVEPDYSTIPVEVLAKYQNVRTFDSCRF
jgi:hypothetical protein